jgi:CxxC motif-containing protein (DUF1111 family)
MIRLERFLPLFGVLSACGNNLGNGMESSSRIGENETAQLDPAGEDHDTDGGERTFVQAAVATEAPAGFDTPTLVATPGSQSVSNGLAEPVGDSFALDQKSFENTRDVTTGLGPVFNARACVECHQNPVAGGASQFTEIRAGHLDATGMFVNPTVPINDGVNTITGRSIINDRAVIPAAQEHVPVSETIHALRATLNTLGDGFVEAIDDQRLLEIAERQAKSGTGVHGEAVMVPVLEAPGQKRVGRFGWKDQQPTILSFAADAYLNEMGITNRIRPKDVTDVGDITVDPEDVPDATGLADIDHFAQFIRGTKVPPRDAVLAQTKDARHGERLFHRIGCATCHVASITTAPAGTVLFGVGDAGGTAFTVPDALGDKIIHPYSDFLLHDIGTGDGIVQTPPQDTANKLRTSPLWGLRTRSRYMHDLTSLTLPNAIARHAGEADFAANAFNRLSDAEKQQIVVFLNSL